MVGFRGHPYLEDLDCWDLMGIDPNSSPRPTIDALIKRVKVVLYQLQMQRFPQDRQRLGPRINARNAHRLLVTLQAGKGMRHLLPKCLPPGKLPSVQLADLHQAVLSHLRLGGLDWVSTWNPDGEGEDRYRPISTPSAPPPAAGVPTAGEAVCRVNCPSVVDVTPRHVTRVVVDLTLEDDDDHVTCSSEHGADTPSTIGLTDGSDTRPSSSSSASASASDVLSHDPPSRRWRGWASGPSGDGLTGEVLGRRAVQRHDNRLASRVYDTTFHPADDQLRLLGPMRGMHKERKRKRRAQRRHRSRS